MEKARLGQPIMPRSPQGLLAVLNRMIICLTFMFGLLCPLVKEVKTIYQLLDINSHKHAFGTIFENGLCKAICNDISKECDQFFSQHKSNYDIQNNSFATVDLSATQMMLKLNLSNNNGNYPIFQSTYPTFTPPHHHHHQQQQQQQQNPNINKSINKRQQEHDPLRRTRLKQESKPSFTTEIPTYWR